MPAAAVVGAAAIGAVGSISAANAQKKAASTAADAQRDATAAQIQLARETRDQNERLYAPVLGQGERARSYLDALYYGDGAYTPPSAPTTPPYTGGTTTGGGQGDWQDLWAPGGVFGNFGGGGYTNTAAPPPPPPPPPASPVAVTRDQVLAQIENTPLARYNNQDFMARVALGDQTYDGANTLADSEFDDLTGAYTQNYADAYGLAGTERTGLRDQAQTNLDQRLANNADVWADWNALQERENGVARDALFSRLGLTGQTGATTRGVAQVGQDYALRAALEDTRLRGAAYDPYYSDINYAERGYYDRLTEADRARADARYAVTGQRANRRQSAFDTRQGGRRSAYDAYAGGRATAYDDYTGFLRGQQARGDDARGAIATGNVGYSSAASQANQTAAQAYANAAYRRGEAQSSLYGDLAGGISNTLGYFSQNQPIQNKSYYGK